MNRDEWSPAVVRALHQYHDAASLPPSEADIAQHGEAADNTAPHRLSPARRSPAMRLAMGFAAVAVVAATLAGLVAIVGRHDGSATGGGTVEVQHTRYRVSIDSRLECDQPIEDGATFNDVIVDMWADRAGRQWHHQVTYPDGTTFDVIMRGNAVYPTALFERGVLATRTIGCVGPDGAQMPLARIVDPYDFINLGPELAPEDRPFTRLFSDVGQLVDMAATDSQGRPAQVWELRTTGSAGFGDTANLSVSQRTTWWIDPVDGTTVNERQFINTIETMGTSTVTETLLSSELIEAPAATFDTSGYRTLATTPRPPAPGTPETTVVGGTPVTTGTATSTTDTSTTDCPGDDLDIANEPPLWRQPHYTTWFRTGCVVRIDVITDRPGPDHCGWSSARVIVVGNPIGTPFTNASDDVQYVRDPGNAFGVGLASGYEPNATLPAAAVDTGYRTDTEALWTVPGDDRFIYLVLDGRTERWPKGEPPGCA